MAQSRLQAVGESEEVAQTLIGVASESTAQSVARETHRGQAALTGMLMMALRALSQRALVAIAAIADLLLIGSVFAALLLIISAPTTPQLIGLAGYALFILSAIWMRRRHA